MQGQCVFQASSTSSSLSGKSPHGNLIWFDSASDKVIDGSAIGVKYQCSGPCQLAVEAVISIPRGTEVVVFRRKWISSKPPRVPCTRLVLLRLPRAVKYQRDFFNRHIIEAQNVTVHAWLERLKDGYERRTYRGSLVRIHKVLRIVPLSASLTKPPTRCPSWPAELMWQLTRNKIYQCPHESGQTSITLSCFHTAHCPVLQVTR